MSETHDTIETHPLTHEQIPIRTAINEFVDSARLETLRQLNTCSDPAGPTTIATHESLTRQTVSSHLTDLVSVGLVNYDSDKTHHWLTAGGVIALTATERCLEEITRDQLSTLTRTSQSLLLLQTLGTRPVDLKNLSSKSDAPSQTTLWRIVQDFSEFGWVAKQSGRYELLADGEQALTAYEEFEETIIQCIKKAPFLQRLDPALLGGDNPFPVHALADARLVFSGPDLPGLAVGAAIKLADPQINRVRILTSVFTPRVFRLYHKLVSFGMTGEGVIDASVYEHLVGTEDLHHVLDSACYDHYRLYRLDEPLTLGLAMYDVAKVAVGAYNNVGEGQHVAVIISTNEDLIEWGLNTYRSYRDQAMLTEAL